MARIERNSGEVEGRLLAHSRGQGDGVAHGRHTDPAHSQVKLDIDTRTASCGGGGCPEVCDGMLGVQRNGELDRGRQPGQPHRAGADGGKCHQDVVRHL